MNEDQFFTDLLDKDTATRHIAQGSDEWDLIRCGRFTSSEWWKLMECGKRPMTAEELKARPKTGKGSKTTLVPDPTTMGEKGVRYIRAKVWETLTGQPLQQAYAYPMVRGKELEPVAVAAVEKKYGIETEIVGFQVFGDHAGGSPDRLICNIDAGLEIKCPSSDEQVDYLMLTDHHDLKRYYPDKYWQCVTLMLFTNRKAWWLCTYDPRMVKEEHQLMRLILEWEKVDEDIDLAIKALEGAVKEKLQLLQVLSKV
jgi:hypothetical protein